MKKILLSLAFACAFTGAVNSADQKIDGSSKDAFERTAKAIIESLPSNEKKIFQDGMMNIIVTNNSLTSGLKGLDLLAALPRAMETAHITLDGMTKEEILARGRELASKNADKYKSEDFTKIIDCLNKSVLIRNPRIEKSDFGIEYITMEISNEMSWPISFVHVSYEVKTPGRAVAWVNDKFGLDISGGIESGETRKISTNVFGIPEIAKNLKVEAHILDVADADRRQLIGEAKFMGNSKELSDHVCD